MNFKTTLFLLVVFAVVAFGLWYAQSQLDQAPTETPDAAETDDTQYVLADRPEQDTITRVQIERPNKPTLVFQRQAGGDTGPGAQPRWDIVAPLEAEAEGFQVRNVVTTLLGLETRSSFTPGEGNQPSLDEAGLEPPRAVVTMTADDDTTYALEIGDKVIMSNDTYVRPAGGEQVHVVARDLDRTLVGRELSEYRAKSLATLRPGEIAELQITHDGTTYALERSTAGEWTITAPVNAPAQASKVRTLITRISGLRVAEFVVDDAASLAPYGLDEPYLTVTATVAQEVAAPTPTDPNNPDAAPETVTVTQTKRLAVGGFAGLGEENRYARTGDARWVATVPASGVAGLIPNLKELRDPQVTRLPANRATKIEITTGDDTATLEKQGGQWRGTGDLAELESAAVQDLLTAFAELAATDYITAPDDPAAYGLDSPRAKVSVTPADGEPVTVHVGAETASGRNAYVRRAGDETVSVVPAAQANRLALDLLSLRSREIFNVDPARIEKIEVERVDRGYTLERVDGTWTVTAPDNVPVDQQHARQLANDLSRLRARQVVSKNLAAYGLTEPVAGVVFQVAPPTPEDPNEAPAAEPATRVLRVAFRDGNAYAAVGEEPYVFEIDNTVYDVITGEFIDRQLFDFGADQVKRVAIEYNENRLALVRENEAWQFEADPYVKLSQSLVQQYIDRLVGLRVQAYLAYRNGNLAAEGLDDPAATLRITRQDDQVITLPMVPEILNACPRKAAWQEQQRIFRLRDEDCEALLKTLEDFLEEK